MHIMPGGTSREFRHVERAEMDGAGFVEPPQNSRCEVRLIVAQYPASGRGDISSAIEQILVRQRNPVQHTAPTAAGKFEMALARGLEGAASSR